MMSVKQITCPACGAPIEAAGSSFKGVCPYCGSPFSVEDEKDIQREQLEQKRRDYRLKQEARKLELENKRLEMEQERLQYERERLRDNKRKRNTETGRSCIKGCSAVVIIVVLAFVALMVFAVYMAMTNEDKLNDKKTSQSAQTTAVTAKKLSDIPETTVNNIKRETEKSMGNFYNALYGGWTEADQWDFVGNYLLYYKDGSGNKLICVYKMEYLNTETEQTQTVYAGCAYENISVRDDGTTSIQSNKKYGEMSYLPEGTSAAIVPSLIHGWFTQEEMYADCVASTEKAYQLDYTDGLYVSDTSSIE